MLITRCDPVARATPGAASWLAQTRGLFARTRWQTTVVGMVWAIMLAWVASYVGRHGHNLPVCDEWAFVPITYAPWSERIHWLGEPHMEHRFPLARVVWLCLLDVTHQDYRAGMWLTVLLNASAALALIVAARRLRGQTALADIGFPLLLLHPGHTENLLMGYQIAFTFTTFFLALFALLVSGAGNSTPARCAVRGALLLIPMAMGGWLGLIFTLPLGGWVAWQLYRATDARTQTRIAVAMVLIAVAAYFGWSVSETLHSRAAAGTDKPIALAIRLRGVAEAAGIGLGPVAWARVSLAMHGWAVLSVELATAIGLLTVGLRRREERPLAWGLLALLLGVWAFAMAVGYSRGTGIASRYSVFTAFGPVVTLLAAARYLWSPRRLDFMIVVVLIGAAYLGIKIYKHAHITAISLDEFYRTAARDAASGMPIDVLAARHVDFWLKTPEGWEELWKHNFPLLMGVPAPSEAKPIPARWHLQERQDGDLPVLHRYRVELDGTHRVAAIHVKICSDAQATWVPLEFEWVDRATGEVKHSIVYPWVPTRKLDTAFWIDSPTDGGELRVINAGCNISIVGVAYSMK